MFNQFMLLGASLSAHPQRVKVLLVVLCLLVAIVTSGAVLADGPGIGGGHCTGGC